MVIVCLDIHGSKINHSLETQPQLKLDSNKIEAQNLELIKPTVS